MDDFNAKAECREFLSQSGCCEMCVLRFLKPKMDEFVKLSEKSEHVEKKIKTDTCVTCFGIFATLDELSQKIYTDEALKLFEVKKFLTSFSLPLTLHLAQLQMWLALLEKFPEMFDEQKVPDIAVKDALKYVLNERLSNELKKELHIEGLMISITFVHDIEKEMLEKLAKAFPELMKDWNCRKKRQRGGLEQVSRAYFEKNFTPETIDVTKLRKVLAIPPESPSTPIQLEKIEFTGPTVFIAGRYNKFSRILSQTPWVLNGKRMAEDSVEEIIENAVMPHFRAMTTADTTVTFMSSGREDVDVRCLGRGRPFALEINNARREALKPGDYVQIEEEVRQSSSVSIRDLQMVNRNDLHHIKCGEEEKRKFYRALCILREESVSEEILRKLQIETPFVIQQWTPLRVLHRRSLLQRPRTIFSVKAFAVKEQPNLIVLDIVTQAGTYVKELVHSEFGRTEPSIASIIGKAIDITSLDVMNIDLNFPPPTQR